MFRKTRIELHLKKIFFFEIQDGVSNGNPNEKKLLVSNKGLIRKTLAFSLMYGE